MPQLRFSEQVEQLKSQFIERLRSLRYEVEQYATLTGKSGGEHSFDILARRNDGFIAYTIAMGILTSDDDSKIGLGEVFSFDDKCYSC